MRIKSRLVVFISLMLLTLSCSQVFALNEILDQAQETDGSSVQIQASEPIGQSFIPTLTPLTSVEVNIRPSNPGFGDDTIMCRIRASTIGGTILGTASQSVTDGFDGWLRFTFDPPIIVTPGSTYVIELDANLATFGWYYASGNPYPDGTIIASGTAVPNNDALFRTYALLPSPVGGISTPTNKFEILTPYLALAGLIAVVSVVYVIKRRKD